MKQLLFVKQWESLQEEKEKVLDPSLTCVTHL